MGIFSFESDNLKKLKTEADRKGCSCKKALCIDGQMHDHAIKNKKSVFFMGK